ncbi:hypothetical protein PFICI_13191 [Pestalotiopsis fici W106-1]|uniref:Protein kinase domain-containing protein n=1 Tax=Pestalotiopsis fici (strain W106-1 / CGMCC3.15140) TaxID=1229662 RepID=W3WNJ0_PESFW|nr:uncharacterized protein PFICI_13191 [Pestalotiopsis fici W106-1]ETS74707.1 hypothetical protein PFICI_13191 [Pestalotiopsis fici W106-1]
MGELVTCPDQESVVEKFKLSVPLDKFPSQILDHAQTLKHLDLSGTGLASLPDIFGQFKSLKIAFFSNCNFEVFPKELAACPELEMVAFRSNRIREIPENALPSRLRWLILTGNKIESLPKSIGKCSRLQKCMLSGNLLRELPDEMSSCHKLGLLRLSANRIENLPSWLFEMPELGFLSFAGNPCSSERPEAASAAQALAKVPWSDVETRELLGEGASGSIFRGDWTCAGESRPVAVKLFKGDITSDGTPLDEMRACMDAGSHSNLIDPLGEILGHPEKKGLLMQLIPSVYKTLGLPPSMETCTRDCFLPTTTLTPHQGLRILQGIASAAAHLHKRGIAHGDLYAHNILYKDEGHALLGDFGAASIYKDYAVEGLEVLAFGHLMEDVKNLIEVGHSESESWVLVADEMASLHTACANTSVTARPSFGSIEHELGGLLSKILSVK